MHQIDLMLPDTIQNLLRRIPVVKPCIAGQLAINPVPPAPWQALIYNLIPGIGFILFAHQHKTVHTLGTDAFVQLSGHPLGAAALKFGIQI